MNLVLFNTHDVVLLFTIFLCAILGFSLVENAKSAVLGNSLLIGFLLSLAAVPLDTLISFGAAVRGWAIDNLPDWFYVFEIGYWLQGPFLLLYLRYRLYENYRLRGVDFFYLVPFLVFLFHQTLAYHMLPTDVKAEIQRGYSMSSETFTIFFITLARELLRLYFGVLCILELRYYTHSLDKKVLVNHRSLVSGLHFVAFGFAALWAWASIIAIFLVLNRHFNTHLPADAMGLISNYGTCFLLLGIVAGCARWSLRSNEWPRLPLRIAIAQPSLQSVEDEKPAPTVNPAYIERLDYLMDEKKMYLQSTLTLEVLATEMSISPRTLSTILNRHYECNFFEFINTRRIEYAKKLLLQDDHQNATMLDIMYEVGFNSKATFNNFFKKMEGVTPREYKKRHLPALQA